MKGVCGVSTHGEDSDITIVVAGGTIQATEKAGMYLAGNLTVNVAASLCGVGISTFYRMKRNYKHEQSDETFHNEDVNKIMESNTKFG